MHLRILREHQKPFFKKYIFYRLEWLKTCFDAFAHTSRPPETFGQKRYFLPSGVVKSVFWCISTYFQITRNFFSKKVFFKKWYYWKSGVVKNVFLCICAYFQITRNFFQKRYFRPSWVVKDMFWCIFAYFQITRNFFSKKIFSTTWSG